MDSFALDKEKWGKGNLVKVDKTSDSLSNSAWGGVSKTKLMEKVLSASNYKSLVKDVYLVVESGWEDAPSQHLKYPIMEIVGDKAVYNRGGLSSALGYGKAENVSAVVSKVEGIYKKLGLDDDKKDEKKEVKNSMKKGNFAEEGSPEEEKDETPEEEKKEKEEEMAAPKEPKEKQKEGSPEEEKSETQEEEDKETKMSLDAYADVPAMLAMLENETKQFRGLAGLSEDIGMAVEELKKGEMCNNAAVAKGMFAVVKDMAAKIKQLSADAESSKAYMAELEGLRKFKAEFETAQLASEIASTMAELKESLPSAEFEAAKEDSKNFSMDSVENWKNKWKAKAFTFAVKGGKKVEPDGKMALPFNNTQKQSVKSLWK